MTSEKEDIDTLERKLKQLRESCPGLDFYRNDNAVFQRDWDKQIDLIIYTRMISGGVTFAVVNGNTLALPLPEHTTPPKPKFKIGSLARYKDGRTGTVEWCAILPGCRGVRPSWRVRIRLKEHGWIEAGEQYFEEELEHVMA